MLNTDSARLPRTSWRRKLTAVALTVGLSTAAITLAGPTRALAEDANITCTPTQNVFAVKTNGDLMLYKFNDLSSTAAPAVAGEPSRIGVGFSNFSKVIAGPDGWLYGIRPATSGGGTLAYHWNGTAFDVQARNIGSVFNIYAVQARANRITIDATGDFYLLQDDGTLRRVVYNAATGAFTHNPVAVGLTGFDAIQATGEGVIYARTTAGALHRYHIEPTSNRLISHRVIGSGWHNFSSFFAVGGDTILGIKAGLNLQQYRYRPDPNPAWVFQGQELGGGWETFLDVTGTSNACKLTKSYVPVTPSVPTESNSPIAVLQSSEGHLEYSHTDNIGRAKWGHQPDPIDFGGTVWNTIVSNAAFTGTPALTQTVDNKIDITLHNRNSRSAGVTQTAPSSSQLNTLVDRGGLMASGSAGAKNPSTNKVTQFAVDGDGALWGSTEGVIGFLPWQRYATTPVLSGTPTVGPGPNNTLTVIARDTAGTYWAANWNGTTLSAFSSLGGSGFTGKAAIVRYPGDVLRVFARSADGHIMTQMQTVAGTAFPGTWNLVGGADQTWPGSPTAIMAPDSGLVEVIVRGTDGHAYLAHELAQGSGSWPEFKEIQLDTVEEYAPDPTLFVYNAGGVQKWAFATYTQDFQVRVLTARTTGISPATAGASMKGAGSDPVFTSNPLP